MPSRVIKTQQDLDGWIKFLSVQSLPMTVTKVAGEKRTNPQNALSHRWYSDIARQRGDVTAARVRAECKLQFGNPILSRDDPEWREWFDQTMRPLGWRIIVEMFERLEPQVTSKMTVKQLSEYMDNMGKFYREKGFRLTDPEALKYGDME